MRTAAVTELKAELSELLRLVRGGEEILVTCRGVPVARIVPVTQAAAGVESLRDLERRGVLRLGSGRLPRNFWKLPRGKDPRASVRRSGRDERERGW
jgi:prevent-host-death family protein